MNTYNTYSEAKINNPEKEVVFKVPSEKGDLPFFIAIHRKDIPKYNSNWIVCTPLNHCMKFDDFFKSGYKLVDGDAYVNAKGNVRVVGNDTSARVINSLGGKSIENLFILSAKALGEAKRGSLQSLKKKALSNPKVKEEYDTLEPEFEKVEWKNGDSCTFSNSCLTGVYVAYDNYNAGHVVYSDGKYFHVIDSQLSKPETPEQKKERELESLADDACELLFGEPINNCRPDVAATVREMILAGYRKPE